MLLKHNEYSIIIEYSDIHIKNININTILGKKETLLKYIL